MAQARIRIKLKSFDYKILDSSVQEIMTVVKKSGARINGPIPLPTKITRYTVLRSPHVDKRSREQFETRIHKRLLDIFEANPTTVDALSRLVLPTGVHAEIKS